MNKTFIRNPIFWIPASVILLDWITKLYFNLTLGKPIVFSEPNLITRCLISIVSIFKILPKLLQGEMFKVKIYSYLEYVYGNVIDRFVAALLIFLVILNLWVLYKRLKPNPLWKYFYFIAAGAILANTTEAMIFGRIIDWLRIDLAFFIETKTSLHSYGFPTVMNLADAILHIFVPLTILFYLGHIVLGRKVKNAKVK